LSVPAAYRRLAIAGWGLYLLSWVTPDLYGHLGARAFVNSVTGGVTLVVHAASPLYIITGIMLLWGWLANFSILIRWPVSARWAWIVAPWITFGLLAAQQSLVPAPFRLFYFYPWAVGIGLIHSAGILTARRESSAAHVY
jgi:hypothetical protein